MKIIFICLLLGVSAALASGGTKSRSPAQDHLWQVPCGANFIYKVTNALDTKTGKKGDVLSVSSSDGAKICSYAGNVGEVERFWSVDSLAFPDSPKRYLITTWQLPRFWEYKIIDTSKKGEACTFWGKTYKAESLSFDPPTEDPAKETLEIERIDQKDPDHTTQTVKRTTCFLDEQKNLDCKDFDATAYP
jgi:hypothetical protein